MTSRYRKRGKATNRAGPPALTLNGIAGLARAFADTADPDLPPSAFIPGGVVRDFLQGLRIGGQNVTEFG
jgi:hypothetical protein